MHRWWPPVFRWTCGGPLILVWEDELFGCLGLEFHPCHLVSRFLRKKLYAELPTISRKSRRETCSVQGAKLGRESPDFLRRLMLGRTVSFTEIPDAGQTECVRRRTSFDRTAAPKKRPRYHLLTRHKNTPA